MSAQKHIDAANEARLVAALAGGDAAEFNIAPAHGDGWVGSGSTTATAERAAACLAHQHQERGDQVSDETMAVARDLCGYFDAELESEDELRRVLAGVHADRVDVPQAVAIAGGDDGKSPVVLQDGDNVLEVEADVFDAVYAATFGDYDVRLPDGRADPMALDSLAATAAKLGFKGVGERIGAFRAALKGMPFVKRGNNEAWTPTPVSSVKVVKPEDYEDRTAIAADIEGFFGDQAEYADEQQPGVLTISAGGRKVEVEEAAYSRLLAVAGVDAGKDLTRAEFGALVTAARNGGKAGLLQALLEVRCETPLYRVTNAAGRTWRPAATVGVAGDVLGYFGRDKETN